MNTEKYDNVYNMLTEKKFEMIENVPDEFKCLKCGQILINACQGPCGCRFCRVCIDGLVESGSESCPGNSDECRESDLSDFHTDYSVNKKISKLLVKCPFVMCTFESELININEHLRVCPNKCLRCVFYDMGCTDRNVTTSNMNEHFQAENLRHMTMLMGIIDNMRNEVDRLKESDAGNRNDIAILKNELFIKNEKIESLEEEINLIKNEKIDYLQMEIVKSNKKIEGALREMQKWKTGEHGIRPSPSKFPININKKSVTIPNNNVAQSTPFTFAPFYSSNNSFIGNQRQIVQNCSDAVASLTIDDSRTNDETGIFLSTGQFSINNNQQSIIFPRNNDVAPLSPSMCNRHTIPTPTATSLLSITSAVQPPLQSLGNINVGGIGGGSNASNQRRLLKIRRKKRLI